MDPSWMPVLPELINAILDGLAVIYSRLPPWYGRAAVAGGGTGVAPNRS